MSVPRLAGMAVLCAITFAPASCSKQLADSYQGWIEANLIFVAPDEVGRVRTLTVQEGDTVKAGDLMFTVDDDLQQADLAQIKASVKNAQQSFDRATMLLKTGAGTQKDFDGAEMVLRDAQARLNSVQTRLSPLRFQRRRRHGAADLFPPRRDGAGGPAGAGAPAARQH
jgi:HlyD family secretion protein